MAARAEDELMPLHPVLRLPAGRHGQLGILNGA
jgi:hypothetical protein